jgi:uncharacterized protein YdaU (DUF1376 family)
MGARVVAKDPAFLFYPNDYIGGTMGMTFEEKGAYVDLLMLQFNRGHMTTHMIGQTVGQPWDNIKCKFVQDTNGLYYNVRLEQEVEKRKNYTASRRNNISGVNQYTKDGGHKRGHMTTHMTGHTTGHMENVNVNENEDVTVTRKRGSGGKGFTPPTLQEVADYCTERGNSVDPESWLDYYTSNGWLVGKNPMKDWRAAVRTWEKRAIAKPQSVTERIMSL